MALREVSSDHTPGIGVDFDPRLRALAGVQSLSAYERVLSQMLDQGTLGACQKDLSPEVQRLAEILDGSGLSERHREFNRAWLQALENSGTLALFPASVFYTEYVLDIGGQSYPAVTARGIDHETRGRAINSVLPYACKGQMGKASELLDLPDCALCTNIAQALDAAVDPAVPCNALAYLGEYLWLVNKFPWTPGDTLILPKAHDDMSERILPYRDFEGNWRYPPEPGKTTGKVLTAEYLETVMAVCDRFAQEAQRNHVMDGMNQPKHEHFKLKPEESPGCRYEHLYRQDAGLSSAVEIYRPLNTPFDALGLASSDKGGLARATAFLLESMERCGEVYTLSYFRGHWFILPRRRDAIGDIPGKSGSTIACHAIEHPGENPGHLAEVRRVVPLTGEFGWSRFLTACGPGAGLAQKDVEMVLEPELTAAQARVLKEYEPVDYRRCPGWGSGGNLRQLEPVLGNGTMAAYARTIIEGRQDPRRDSGHAEFATYAAVKVALFSGIPDGDREAAALAGVLHDTGYSFIENVTRRYDSISAGVLSDDPEIRRLAAEDDVAIRREHQAASVEYAKLILAGHPRLEQITAMVADHDTRAVAPDLPTQCFWDGDWMARISLPTVKAMWARTPALRGEINRTVLVLEEQVRFAQPKGLNTVYGYAIARLELINTACELLDGNLQGLPAEMQREYAAEIAQILRRRL